MIYLTILIPLLMGCQMAPALIETAEAAFVQEAIALEVHKEHGTLNISLDVNKEPTEETPKE